MIAAKKKRMTLFGLFPSQFVLGKKNAKLEVQCMFWCNSRLLKCFTTWNIKLYCVNVKKTTSCWSIEKCLEKWKWNQKIQRKRGKKKKEKENDVKRNVNRKILNWWSEWVFQKEPAIYSVDRMLITVCMEASILIHRCDMLTFTQLRCWKKRCENRQYFCEWKKCFDLALWSIRRILVEFVLVASSVRSNSQKKPKVK